MNTRIKELAGKVERIRDLYNIGPVHRDAVEQFAELIIQECKEDFAKVWYEQGMDIRGAEWNKFITRFEELFGVDSCD